MTEQQFNFGILGAFIAMAAVCLLVLLIAAATKKRRKPNIRVPRETLWARTNRYHGSKP